jgi:hypothetical protein
MLMSRHQNTRRNHNIKAASRHFENVSNFKFLGTTVVNKILIYEEIKSRFISGMFGTIQFRFFCLLFCCLKT